MDRWATFDCYGTLVDWNAGIRAAVGEPLLARYHELEPEVQAEQPTLSYRNVMREVLRRAGFDDPDALGRSLPSWPVFPEVPAALTAARERGWKLAILSNTDDDFIAASQVQIGVPFDEIVVAQEIGSYKPAHRHWDELFLRTRAPREGHVHVAASLFHDVAPCHDLGLTCVWINRVGERATDPRPARELTDLRALPETLDELVPL